MVIVIHKKNEHQFPKQERVYVGRGSFLGNPFTSIHGRPTKAEFVVGSRAESIACYREHLLRKLAEKDPQICMDMNSIYRRAKYGTVYLTCYCSPEPCHADVIKELIDAKFRERIFPFILS